MICFKNKVVFISLLIICNVSQAGVYVGFGINASKDQYSVNQTTSDSNFANNASAATSAVATIGFNGTSSELREVIFNAYPTTSLNLSLSVIVNDDDGVGTIKPLCISGGYVRPDFICTSQSIETTTPTLANIQQVFGGIYMGFLQSIPSVSMNFATIDDRLNFQIALGDAVLANFLGTTTYTDEGVIAFLQLGNGGSPLTFIKPTGTEQTGTSGVQIGILSISDPNFANAWFSSQEAIWNMISEMLANGQVSLIKPTPISIADNASSTNFTWLINIGYAKMVQKFFYAGEFGIDFGSSKIGDNAKSELEIKYAYSASILGKVGYNVFGNSVNYLNLGLMLRKYDISGFGIKETSVKEHLTFGIGMESMLTKNINIFTEFNHSMTLSKVSSALPVNVKTDKLSVGIKYYFDENPISKERNTKVSSESIAKYGTTAQVSKLKAMKMDLNPDKTRESILDKEEKFPKTIDKKAKTSKVKKKPVKTKNKVKRNKVEN